MMWLKENRFRIRLGGQIFINVPVLIQFNGESLFTVRREEDTGQVGIDCEVYDADGDKIASIKKNNPYAGDNVAYAVDRSEDHITLKDTSTGVVLAHIKKNAAAGDLELDVSVRTYLPDGRFLDAGPDSCTIGGLFMKGNAVEDCAIGIGITAPNLIHAKEYKNETVKLDGMHFFRCKFDGCTLEYAGLAPVSLRANKIEPTCKWNFVGAARLTVQFLHDLYGDPGLRPVADGFLRGIRGGA